MEIQEKHKKNPQQAPQNNSVSSADNVEANEMRRSPNQKLPSLPPNVSQTDYVNMKKIMPVKQ